MGVDIGYGQWEMEPGRLFLATLPLAPTLPNKTMPEAISSQTSIQRLKEPNVFNNFSFQ